MNSTALRMFWLGLLTTFVAGQAPAIDSVAYPDKVQVGLERPLKVSLNGDWKFQRDPQEIGETEKWFEQGKISAEEARALAQQVAQDGHRELEEARLQFREALQELLQKANFATTSQVAKLETRVAALEAKLASVTVPPQDQETDD